jgi:hypothetical protein
MGSAFSCMVDLAGRGADITAMLNGWIKLSEDKGWPRNEEGWRRYLSRNLEGGTFPRVKKETGKSCSPMTQTPPEFVAWWQGHPDSGGGPSARVAYSCAIYHSEWKAANNPPMRAA